MSRFNSMIGLPAVAGIALLMSGSIWADSAPANPSAKIDISKPQSPPKPAPEGMEFIDQGKFDPRLKGYFMPDGFKLEIVADEQTTINPVGMTFSNDGTLFVLEWLPDENTWPESSEKITYKDGTTRTVATMKKKVKDIVKILKYNSEKKQYDQSQIILEDELPSSILVHDGWIYLSGRSTIRRYKQSKENGPYDVKEIIAQGFCGFHHHQVSGMTIGNDGWLYITSGDDHNVVEGSDGSRATVLRTGAVFRCRPDGSKMHVYSIGYRNPYRDLVYDIAGNWFHVDNDNEDGSKFTGCRLMHVAEESDFGWRLYPGARCCRADHVRGAVYGELPGKLPPMLKTGRGSPAGLLIYNDAHLPDFYRGWLYYPDVFRKVIRAYKPIQSGSSFEIIHEFEFLKSDDPLFRPCQMVTGPDGAIYICDWRTDSGGAGKLFGDGKHGRIYRVTWAGGKVPGAEESLPEIPTRSRDRWKQILQANDEDLLQALTSESITERQVAQAEIRRRGEKFRDPVLKLLSSRETPFPTRIACIGLLQSFWNAEIEKQFIQFLNDTDDDIRRLAADALALHSQKANKQAHDELLKLLSDPILPVRRSAALAIGRIHAPSAPEVLVNIFKFDEGKDLYLVDGYLRAIERTGKSGIQKLIDMSRSGSDAEREKVVAAFLTLRCREAAEAIPELLRDPHLTKNQQVDLIHSYTNYLLDPPISLQPLLQWVKENPNLSTEAQSMVIEVLNQTGNLKGAQAIEMLQQLLESPQATARMTAIRAIEGSRLVELAPKLVEALKKADRSNEETLAILRAMQVARPKADSLAADLESMLKADGPINLKIELLRTLQSIDPKAARVQSIQLLESNDLNLVRESVSILGSEISGAKLLGERFLDKKLPNELLPQVSEALKRFAEKDPEIRELLGKVMKGGLLLSLNPKEIEAVRTRVKTKGNPQKGKEIYLNSKNLACINCHKMEGLGGNVGPDLTRLWETASIEKVMESILEPNKEIKEGFQSYRAVDKNGRAYTGLKVSDTPNEITLRDADGKDIRLLREDLEDFKPSPISLMPDNVVSQLNYDQFIDLIAFLNHREAQESLRGMVTEFWVVGPFGPDHKTAYAPEKNSSLDATYESLDRKPIKWEKLSTTNHGYLDLRAKFNREYSSVYAMVFVYSPNDQKVTMISGSDDSLKVWINNRLVHEVPHSRSAQPEQDRLSIELKSGWNPVLIKVVNGTTDHGLFLKFIGQDLKFSTEKK